MRDAKASAAIAKLIVAPYEARRSVQRMETGPSTTDWISAIATVFAAIGTVGAVAVALWQILRQGRRNVIVRCSQAVIGDVETIHALSVRATNDGPRPVRADDGLPDDRRRQAGGFAFDQT